MKTGLSLLTLSVAVITLTLGCMPAGDDNVDYTRKVVHDAWLDSDLETRAGVCLGLDVMTDEEVLFEMNQDGALDGLDLPTVIRTLERLCETRAI